MIYYQVIRGTKDKHQSINDSFSKYIALSDAQRFNRDYQTDEFHVIVRNTEVPDGVEYVRG